MHAYSFLRVLLFHPGEKFLHLRFRPQFFNSVEFFAQTLVVKEGVDLSVAGRTDISGWSNFCFFPLAVLSRHQVMHAQTLHLAIAKFALHGLDMLAGYKYDSQN